MKTWSLIICAYTEKRWDDLLAALASVKNQRLHPDEIILVIDHNPSLYLRATHELEGVVIIENSLARGLSGGRNSGIAIAQGEWIAFMDEDAVAEEGWLEKLQGAYQDPRVMGVGGAILPLWLAGRPAWFPDEFTWVVGCTYRGLPKATSTVRNLIGCNMSFRAEVFRSIGGFRTGLGRVGTLPFGCEETELCIRASQRLSEKVFVYEPQARVFHRVPKSRSSLRYFLSRCYAEGISKAMVASVTGGRDGLSSERAYTRKILPEGILRGVRDALFARDLSGLGRAGTILAGFLCTALGFLAGKLSLFLQWKSFRRPIEEVEFM